MTDDEEIRLFTVEQANALLPDVAPLLEALRDAHAGMETVQETVMESIATNGGGKVHREFLEFSSEAARAAGLLADLGVVVRDPETGLIDFPSMRDGHEVFLCFLLGEESVAWWHPPETGRAGREPV